nr:MAG TPA: hypothetical protein [Caudoviricetes sp.]
MYRNKNYRKEESYMKILKIFVDAIVDLLAVTLIPFMHKKLFPNVNEKVFCEIVSCLIKLMIDIIFNLIE